jgi:dTDP-4-amino-4,6-dideoxygalactose transaminase
MYSRPSYEALRNIAVRKSDCPHAEHLSERMLNLPTHPFMRQSDLGKIIEVFQSILARRRSSDADSIMEHQAAKGVA